MKSIKTLLTHDEHGYGDYTISFYEENFDDTHDYNRIPVFSNSIELSKSALNELGWEPSCSISMELKLVRREDIDSLPSVTLDGVEMSASQARKILNDMLDDVID